MRPALFCLLAGCSFRLPSSVVGADAPGGGGEDAPEGCRSYSQQFDTCALPAGEPLVLSGDLRFDTNTGELRDAANNLVAVTARTLATQTVEVEAILASSVTLMPGTHLRADGPRPFAIVASDAIVLASGAVIDVADGGAGARSGCGSTPTTGSNRDGGAGGGGGGGFGGAGGAGGAGNDDGTASTGGSGGDAATVPAGPLGGCPGAAGGDDNNDSGGSGGKAGGAVYLVSAMRIDITATAGIAAGGGGGRGGDQHFTFFGDAGGGGGGSGGMILLEAPIITVDGTLAANGGGGGEGSGGQGDGNDGSGGLFDTLRATGGSGNGFAADGALGGAKVNIVGDPCVEVTTGGGGGGGGGAGIIHVETTAPQLGALISPPPR